MTTKKTTQTASPAATKTATAPSKKTTSSPAKSGAATPKKTTDERASSTANQERTRDREKDPSDVARDQRLRKDMQKDGGRSTEDRHRERLTATEAEEDGVREDDDNDNLANRTNAHAYFPAICCHLPFMTAPLTKRLVGAKIFMGPSILNFQERTMPRGDKSSYTDKQKRQTAHIREGYEKRGISHDESEARAWATVNKTTHGGMKSGSGRGKATSKPPTRKSDRPGAQGSSKRSTSKLSTSGRESPKARSKKL